MRQSLVLYRISSTEAMGIKKKQMDLVGFYRQIDRFYQILWEYFGGTSEDEKRIFRTLFALWLLREILTFLRFREGKEIGVRMLDRDLRSGLGTDSWNLRLKAPLSRNFYPRLF